MSSEYSNRDSSPVRRVRERHSQTDRGLRVTASRPVAETGPLAASNSSETLSGLGHFVRSLTGPLVAGPSDTQSPMKATPEQQRFLHDEFFGLTLGATVQRAKVYGLAVADQDRRRFQGRLQQHLESIAECYQATQDDASHVAHIEQLANDLSTECGAILRNGRFRIGPSQKALNLFLKYLWCAGEIVRPPHCPFDYRIIQQIKLAKPVNWTELDDSSGYMGLVAAARVIANPLHLSDWELQAYNAVSQAAIRAT